MGSRDRRSLDRRSKRAGVVVERRRLDRRKGRDRREAERVPLELWMEEVSGDDVYFRRTGNISAGGVFFERAIPHPIGTTVTLKFALPGNKEMVVARGKVVSAADDDDLMGMGVKFVSFEGDGAKRISFYLRSL